MVKIVGDAKIWQQEACTQNTLQLLVAKQRDEEASIKARSSQELKTCSLHQEPSL
jgi:hypothetical protein